MSSTKTSTHQSTPDFATAMKTLRLELRPLFKSIMDNNSLDSTAKDAALTDLETKQEQLVAKFGFDMNTFNTAMGEHYMDFSSSNPDEWIIRHDPEHATLISENTKKSS